MRLEEMQGMQFRATYGNRGVRYYMRRPNGKWERTDEYTYHKAERLFQDGKGKSHDVDYGHDIERITITL